MLIHAKLSREFFSFFFPFHWSRYLPSAALPLLLAQPTQPPAYCKQITAAAGDLKINK